MKGISIIVPAYNEEHSIGGVLRALLESVQSKDDYEIIVVDDGSTDITYRVCSEVEGILIVRHNRNKGYGAAIKTGVKNAKYDAIAIIDADGTYPTEKVSELAKIYQSNDLDMVVGARIGPDARVPIERRPAKFFLGLIANYLSGEKIPDLNSGLRIMNKEVLEKFVTILPDGFSFTSTITLALLLNGYSVQYTQIAYNKRIGKSKIKPISDTLNFIRLVIGTILYFDPLRVFIPLTILLFLIAFVVLIGSYWITGKPMDVTFGIIIVTAVIILAIGMLADLIHKRMK
jgi:glycosyltransferase involved in cell wall biosynthesis